MTSVRQPLGRLDLLVVLLVGIFTPVSLAGYTVGDPPTLSNVPGELMAGQGLPVITSNGVDIDTKADGPGEPVEDEPEPEEPEIDCEPEDECDDSCDEPPPPDEFTPQRNGMFTMQVTMDDAALYADDPAETYHFSIEGIVPGQDDDSDCTSCGSNAAQTSLNTGLASVYLSFPLGLTADGESAGAIWLHEKEPSTTLIDRQSFHYDLTLPGVSVSTSGDDLLSVETPLIYAELTEPNTYTVVVSFYTDSSKTTLLRKWTIEEPDGDSTHDDVTVTEEVASGGSLTTRAIFEYAGTTGSRDWTLTTKDGTGSTLQIEETTWVTTQTDGNNDPIERRREYVRKAPGGTTVYVEHITYKKFSFAGGKSRSKSTRMALI